MTRRLRTGDRSATNGLILANGGVATYQHTLILSRNPRPAHSPYPTQSPRYEIDAPPPIAEAAEGEGVIEVRSPPFPLLYILVHEL